MRLNKNCIKKKYKQLQVATIMFITEKLVTDEKLDYLKAIFHAIDLNGDGRITKEEMLESQLMPE